ncbi:MAG: hypothetical protein KC418_24195 [Anaerolineales bacterium]|nr:hypothetical protein [Anaerolineales bacterium]MCB8952839.1 hypothetical protein [Ardenticatenales bacterium]
MNVIQIVRFKLNAGVDEAAFRAINERFQKEVVPTLPGLLRREATVGENGEWLLVLRYDTMENARGGAQRDTSEMAHTFMSFIDMRTMSAGFFTIVSE